MGVNPVKPGGVDGPGRPEKGRIERVDSRTRPAENKPAASPSQNYGKDQVDLSNRGVDFESRAKELAEQIVRSDDNRRAKVERAKKLVASGAIDSREQYEKAAEGLLQEVSRDSGGGRKG